MPRYDYCCRECGMFEAVAGYDDRTIACPRCQQTADRNPVPSSVGITIKGGPNQPMPPKGDTAAINGEMHKELKKKGWSVDRTVEEMRKNRTTDSRGRLAINTAALPKEAK